MFRFLRTYLPTLLIAALILHLSLLREPQFRLNDVAQLDKLAHMLAYSVLASVFTANLWQGGIDKRPLRATLVILLPAIYGALIELLQEYFFAPRTGSLFDWLADFVGVLIGWLLAEYILSKLPFFQK